MAKMTTRKGKANRPQHSKGNTSTKATNAITRYMKEKTQVSDTNTSTVTKNQQGDTVEVKKRVRRETIQTIQTTVTPAQASSTVVARKRKLSEVDDGDFASSVGTSDVRTAGYGSQPLRRSARLRASASMAFKEESTPMPESDDATDPSTVTPDSIVETSVLPDGFSESQAGFLTRSVGPRLAGIQASTVKVKRARYLRPAGGWDNSKYRFKFGWTPFPEHPSPTPEAANEVLAILQKWLMSHDGTVVAVEPAHGAAVGLTVDALVRTIMSQATNNDAALVVQDALRKRFTYHVNGQEIVGTIPNYHAMRRSSVDELKALIQTAGLYNLKAIAIKKCLDTIVMLNTGLTDPQEAANLVTVNQQGAADFVPGELSIDFLNDKTMIEKFNFLCGIDQVGVKTATCILEFNYKYPLCAVDTHVFKMTKWLGWVPAECVQEDKAAMHLDARLPSEIKHAVHQAFWHHGQKCPRCKTFDEGGVPSKKAPCPLETYLRRKRFNSRPLKTKAAETNKDGNIIEMMEEVKVKVKVRPTRCPYDKFTHEEAEAAGYELRQVSIDDDFDTGSANKKVKLVWVRKVKMEE